MMRWWRRMITISGMRGMDRGICMHVCLIEGYMHCTFYSQDAPQDKGKELSGLFKIDGSRDDCIIIIIIIIIIDIIIIIIIMITIIIIMITIIIDIIIIIIIIISIITITTIIITIIMIIIILSSSLSSSPHQHYHHHHHILYDTYQWSQEDRLVKIQPQLHGHAQEQLRLERGLVER